MNYELRFTSLFDPGRALCFPCDQKGDVILSGLSEAATNNLRRAQADRHEFAMPVVAVVLPTIRKPIK